MDCISVRRNGVNHVMTFPHPRGRETGRKREEGWGWGGTLLCVSSFPENVGSAGLGEGHAGMSLRPSSGTPEVGQPPAKALGEAERQCALKLCFSGGL